MTIRVKIYSGYLRGQDFKNEIDTQGTTVGECLLQAIAEVPELRSEILDDAGDVQLDTCVFVNGEMVSPDELLHTVMDGDTIFLLPITAGG